MNHTIMSRYQIQVNGKFYKMWSFGSKLDPSTPATGFMLFPVAVPDVPVLVVSFGSPSQGSAAALAMLPWWEVHSTAKAIVVGSSTVLNTPAERSVVLN